MAKIMLDNVSISYPIYDAKSVSLSQSILSIGGKLQKNKNSKFIVNALNNVTLSLSDGDRLGLVGHNGAGKSTLLRTIAGVYEPTAGNIFISGKVSSVFSLGSGMALELTGYENVIRMSLLLGLTKKQAKENFEDIQNFTELGHFMGMPVRTYSQGMLARLLFAIATSIHPNILLIDEVIGTGDKVFQKKAQERLSQFISKASILVLASHSNETIVQFCNQRLELEAGTIKKLEYI